MSELFHRMDGCAGNSAIEASRMRSTASGRMLCRRRRSTIAALCAATASITVSSRFASAAFIWTYNPDGSTQNWSTAADWNGSNKPSPTGGSNSTAITIYNGTPTFPNTVSSALTINDDLGAGSPSTFILNSLSLGGKASGTNAANLSITLTGATMDFAGTTPTITLGAVVNASSNATLTYLVQNNILLSGTTLFTGTGNATSFTFSGVIDDAGAGYGITKTGTKIVILTGANTYTGTTNIGGGEINVSASDSGTAGPLGIGPIVFSGGSLQYSAANQYDYSSRFSTANGQAYSIDTNGQNVTYATALNSSGGSLTKQGLGQLTLSAANTYSGNTTLQGGTLEASVAGGLGTGMVTVQSSSSSSSYSPILKLDNVGGLGSSQTLVLTDNSAALAKANLNYSGTDTIFSLIHNGVTEPVGVYGTGGTAESWLTGTGSLTVTYAPEPGVAGLLVAGTLGLLRRRRRLGIARLSIS
jgi:MYXO-CTERM domain-containing protein